MKFCGACGTQLKDNASFCSACGNPCKKVEVKQERVFCRNCGIELSKDDMFCPECGTARHVSKERGSRANEGHTYEVEKKTMRTQRGRNIFFLPVFVLAIIGLLAVLAFPIVDCESEWINAWGGGVTTITLWDTLEDIVENGTKALDNIDVIIGLTAVLASIMTACGAIVRSKAVCAFFSGTGALVMISQLVAFEDSIRDLYYFGEFFVLSHGFWIPLAALALCFFCTLLVPAKQSKERD